MVQPRRKREAGPIERGELLEVLRSGEGRPMGLKELHTLLNVSGRERRGFQKLLSELVRDKLVERVGSKRYRIGGRGQEITGKLVGSRSGHGFVVPDSGGPDLYVGRLERGEARHGDRVAVQLRREDKSGRRSGRIARILEPSAEVYVGVFHAGAAGGQIAPRDERRGLPLPASGELTPGDGELVLVRAEGKGESRRGRILEILGDPLDGEVTLRAALRERGFEEKFPSAAIVEAGGFGTEIDAAARRERTDFRAQLVVTIDGDDARDFDDAVSLESKADGWKLTVHIADVSHYVTPGSALDRAARERSTSIYFPERAVPMLPAELSENLCSLRPERERLVQSAVLTLDRGAAVRKVELHDGVIRSRARLTYSQVAKALDGDAALRDQLGPIGPMLESMAALARRLRQQREARGALDFDFPEAEVELDPHGRLVAVVRAERTEAHRLIEEFMLLANEAVARELLENQIPALYRIHAAPDPVKLAELAEVAAHFGHRLPGNPAQLKPRDLQRFLATVDDKPEGPLLHQLTLQALMQARYAAKPEGHFGLAAKIYTHFTSPIRRYPDLIVHRILRGWRRGELKAQRREQLEEELPGLAEHSSERERAAADAEYEVVAARRAALLAERIGEAFAGRITGVKSFGLFVELEEPFADGLLPDEALPGGPYVFEERSHELRSTRGGQAYRLGDPIQVRVERVDRLLHRVTFGLA